MTVKKVGILTGGGDCPGLNSVIYGIMLKAFDAGVECVGILKGWKGFIENKTIPLNIAEHDDLHTVGGTLLYTSRTNPFKYAKAKIVGCPKTIDNDLAGTHYTFGFWSAVQLASNALDNLTTTARSHQRVFVVEIMGRDAGFLTMYSGISAGADIILIPETPFDFEMDIVDVLKKRVDSGYTYHIIATSEGAYPNLKSLERDFKTISKEVIDKLPKDSFGNPLLAKLNISQIIVNELNLRDDLKKEFKKNDVEFECRSVVLGHTMRAGTPNSFDRILGLRFGLAAMKLVLEEKFGHMVSLQGNKVKAIPLLEGIKKKYITAENDKMELRDLLVKVRYLSKQ